MCNVQHKNTTSWLQLDIVSILNQIRYIKNKLIFHVFLYVNTFVITGISL